MALLLAAEFNRAMQRERVFHDQLDPLAVSDEVLLRYYRFPRHEILNLSNDLGPLLERATRRNHALPVVNQVLVALRFFASGSFQNVLGCSSGLTQPTISRIITAVTIVLNDKASADIRMPSTAAARVQTMREFADRARFPQIIGAIDGTHIPIKAPHNDEHLFVNRKGFHSLNMQVICNAQRLILSYCPRFPGSTHDAYVFRQSSIAQRFQNGEFGDGILIGDSGYPLEPYLLTPIANPRTPAEQAYNISHIHTRIIVEQCFGVLKSRFRCLHKSGGNLQYNPLKAAQITVSCMYLHNICINRNIPDPEYLEVPDEIANIHPNEVLGGRVAGETKRDQIIADFFS